MSAHRPRKRFGQHFLVDERVIEHLVRLIAPRQDETLVEIGPGQGVLTRALLDEVEHLHVVELDRDLITELERTISARRLTIHSADALRFDFRTLAGGGARLRVVGNLPYNISTPLLFHLLGQANVIADMHFMLQHEVVQRLVAGPGDPHRGRLSVMVQYHCRVDFLMEVPPKAFHPPPKVNSAVARLVPHGELPCPARDPDMLATLVNRAFSQRRKTLRNALKSALEPAQIEAAGVSPTARAEQLTLANFVALANMASHSEEVR